MPILRSRPRPRPPGRRSRAAHRPPPAPVPASDPGRRRGRPAHGGDRGAGPPCGLERRAQLDPAGRAGELDGEHPAQVRDHGAELSRRSPAHRDVVLLHRGGRQRVDRSRRRQAAVLGRHRRLGVLGDHQPRVDAGVGGEERRQAVRARGVQEAIGAPLGDRSELRCRDRQEVAGERHRGAVEVAARLDPAVGQDHRVVDRRAQLRVGDRRNVGTGVARGAVHLRAAADRVGVLDPRVVLAMAGDYRRALEQAAQVRRAVGLARLRAQRDEVGGEGAVGAQQRLRTGGGCEVGDPQQRAEILERQDQHPRIPSVPLISARPSFGPSTGGSIPACASASAAGTARSPSPRTSPSPIIARAQWASGARSPLAPREPCSGTTGSRPTLSIASIVSASSGLAPTAPSPASGRARRPSPAPPRARPAGPCRPHASGSGPAAARSAARPESASGPASRTGRDPVGRLVGLGEPLDHGGGLLHRRDRIGHQLGARAVAGNGDHVGGGRTAGPELDRQPVIQGLSVGEHKGEAVSHPGSVIK